MARLAQRIDGEKHSHELLFQSTSIGRGRLNDIVVDDPGERRLHAEVVSLGRGRHLVRDNRSRGGVRVNGERVEEQRELRDGDVLQVGRAEFVFEAAPEEGARPEKRAPRLGRGVVRLTFGTLVSRLLGYVREMVAMAYFGATGAFDAYVAATTLPNLFRDVLGEYAAENAFMPTYKTLVGRGREAEARRLMTSVMRVVVVSGVVLVVLGVLLAPWLIVAIVPGFATRHPHLVDTATALARWMMPFLLIIAVAAVFASLLLAERRFLRYSLAPAGSSACAIGAMVLLKGRLDIGSLAVGVVVGGFVQMAICAAPYIGRRRRDDRRRGPVDRAALRKIGRSVVPIALAGILSKVAGVVDRILASCFCHVGRIASLYGAHRLLQLPFGILGLAVGRAAFPSLIEEASSQDGDGFSRQVVRALRLNAFLMLPATVGLVLLARPFVSVMFERRAFTAEHTGWVALALVCYSVGLVAMGARTVLSRAFYALLNTRTPFYLSAASVGANVVLSVALVITPLGHGGLALASAVAAWLQASLLLVMLRREVARHGRRLSLAGLGCGLARLVACAVVMAGCTWACARGLVGLWEGRGIGARVLSVAVPGLVGLAAYVGAAVVLQCEELGELRRRKG